MGVDYVVNWDCEPKDEHGVDGLLELQKASSYVDVIVRQLNQAGDKTPLEEVTITRVLRRPEGDVETKVPVRALLDQLVPLENARPACAACPADRNSRGFGCFGYINYPMSEAAERWLLSRLPDDLSSPAMYLLTSAIEDFNYDGAPARKMRAAGDTFFEARQPPVRTWGRKRLFRGYEYELASDQLFHMMFHVGDVQPMHAALICVFTGLVPFEALKDREALLRPSLAMPDEGSSAQLARFLSTLAFAAAHELSVSVSA